MVPVTSEQLRDWRTMRHIIAGLRHNLESDLRAHPPVHDVRPKITRYRVNDKIRGILIEWPARR
jgi:hypothetical protein